MKPVCHTIFQVQEECTITLREIAKVLVRERECLVKLEINEISETTRLKESFNLQLLHRIKRLKSLVEGNFEHLQGLEEQLTKEELTEWNRRRDEFWKAQLEVKRLCEVNQGFLKLSLRNLGTLTDHLRRLFGDQPLYSPKGTKIDRASQGRVLEASY